MAKPKVSTVLMFVAFGILLVASIALLIVGVATHEEPGFSNPEARWDHVPVRVSCRGYVPAEDDACETVASVVGTINHRLGFEMLAVGEGGDVVVTMRAPVEVAQEGEAQADGAWPATASCSRPGECFELVGAAGTYERCRVQTMNVSGGAGDLEWLVVYHGLGHCLGLAHDSYEMSIMYPTQRETPDLTIPPWISDFDRGLLRSRYAP